MAWFKCGGGGIPAALKSLMNAVLNKKWGTSGTYPPETWPETVNLMGPLEEKTVSGSVVAFSDGADDVPIKSASFGILASGGGGTPSTPVPIVGKSSVTIYQTGKNFIDFASHVTTGTSVGMTFSATADGGISYSGTATGTFGYATAEFDFTIKSGQTFTFSRNTAFNYIHRIRLVFSDDTTANVSISANNTSVTYTPAKDVKAVRLLLAGLTVDTYYNDTVYVQTEYGSTPTTFQKYKSKTPITIQLGQTVYGGTIAEDGTLNITHAYAQLSKDETWLYSSGWSKTNTNVFYTQARHEEISFASWSEANMLACNMLPVGSRNSISDADSNMLGTSGNVNQAQITVRIDKTICADLTAFNQFLTDNAIYYVYKLATPIVITGLDEISISTYLGDNAIWCDSGDSEVVYRSSGTRTLIPPTLITKAITENGTYTAAADNADGYSSVTVNVPTGATNIETVLGSGVLIEVAGVSGTDVSRTMWTRTAAQDEKVIFHPNTQVKTNTGANDGYFKVLKNGVVVVSTYANTSTTTSFSIPDIDLEAGDVLTISVGFDNYHTSAWFDIWSTITILSSGSAPVLGLGLGNPGPVNEPEQEEEPDAAPEEIQEETPEEVDQNESDE